MSIRNADMQDRFVMGNWAADGKKASAVMPLRYAATKDEEEICIQGVQALLSGDAWYRCETWADFRLFWANKGTSKLEQYHIFMASALVKQHMVDFELASHQQFVSTRVSDKRFKLVEGASRPPVQGDPSKSPVRRESKPRRSVPSVEDWRAARRNGSLAHACKGGRPICAWKQSKKKAFFKKQPITWGSPGEALLDRTMCGQCLRVMSKAQKDEIQSYL